MNTPNMETEQHQGQDNEYGNGQWADISGYSSSQHQSPTHEYNGFGFIAPTTLPVEPSYHRAIPPPFTAHQQSTVADATVAEHDDQPVDL